MWKNIVGFEDNYMINEDGNIINKKTNKYLHPYITNKGYKVIDLYKNNKKHKFLVHRLVAINFIPNPNSLPVVCHLDNIKLNTNVNNLKWGTYSENNAQAIRDGLNKVPRPDSRVFYSIYNKDTNDCVYCHGAKEATNKLCCTESVFRNTLFRKQKIKNGPYAGYNIKKLKRLISYKL